MTPSFGCSAYGIPWRGVMGGLTTVPILQLMRHIRGPGAMRGVPQSGLWSEEAIASSGTGSERAQGRERSRGDPSASQGPRATAQQTEGALLRG